MPLALVLTAALGWVAHRRQGLCAVAPHGYARRAPIAGASGRDTFVCSVMVHGAPAGDKVLVAVWLFSVLAAVRSVLIDRKERRERARYEE